MTFDGKGRVYFSDKPATNTGQGGVYRIDPDSSVTRVLAPPNIQVPSGLVISPDDKVFYLVESNPAANGAHVFASSGKLLKLIPIPEELVTNCAFGGADLKTLYVTAGKTLFKVRNEIEGTRR